MKCQHATKEITDNSEGWSLIGPYKRSSFVRNPLQKFLFPRDKTTLSLAFSRANKSSSPLDVCSINQSLEGLQRVMTLKNSSPNLPLNLSKKNLYKIGLNNACPLRFLLSQGVLSNILHYLISLLIFPQAYQFDVCL